MPMRGPLILKKRKKAQKNAQGKQRVSRKVFKDDSVPVNAAWGTHGEAYDSSGVYF
jgi:hypothetical protein